MLRPIAVKAVMSKFVNAAPACAFSWMGEPGSEVFEPERVFGKPRDLENDPPGPTEVWDVDLETARETRARGMLGVAAPTF